MNATTFWTALAAASSLVLGTTGCGRDKDLGPPQIVYGQAECELCRMIISEEPFAAACVIDSSDGVRKLAFDDIGCLLDYLRDDPPSVHIVSFVHDYDSREWIEADKAIFVRSGSLQTPMASNLAACKPGVNAEDLRRRFPGVIHTLDQLLAAGDRPGLVESTERSSP